MTYRSYGDIQIYAGSGCPELAQGIADYIDVPLTSWNIIDFPNENIWVQLHGSARGKDVYLISSHNKPVHRNIMEMLIAIDCLKRDSAARITAVMPYLAYSQSDQKTQPRVPITARLMADLIEAAGADRWMTVDLHAGQIQGFYKIPGDSLTARYIFCDYLRTKDISNAVLVTPDLGFAKTGRKYADLLNLPLAFVEKRRLGNDLRREALTLIGDVEGKDCIIVDDLVDTAGSITQAVQVVKDNGANEVDVVFTHPVLSDPAMERFAAAPIREIITTDTLPIRPDHGLNNLKILSTSSLLGEVIVRSHEGRSVGELFDE